MQDSRGIPQELTDAQIWTHCRKNPAKAPIVAPGDLPNALTYSKARALAHQQGVLYGILAAPSTTNNYLFIDVDYPPSPESTEEKASLTQQLRTQQIEWCSDAHLKTPQVTALFKSIKSTLLDELTSQTYTEFSPSGCGLRIIISCPDKQRIQGAYAKIKKLSTKPQPHGQISVHSSFVTITEHQLPNSPSTVAEVPLNKLCKLFALKLDDPEYSIHNEDTDSSDSSDNADNTTPDEKPSLDEESASEETIATTSAALSSAIMSKMLSDLPSYKEVQLALNFLPLDRNKRLQRAWENITGEAYEHYKFWLYVGMALHNLGEAHEMQVEMYRLFVTWSSSQDDPSYVSDEDIRDHWKSFGNTQTTRPITWSTIKLLVKACTFDYPSTRKSKSGVPEPIYERYENFKHLLDHYDLTLHIAPEGLYVSGDVDVCESYFGPRSAGTWLGEYYGPISDRHLADGLLELAQASLWTRVTRAQIQDLTYMWIRSGARVKQFDLFNLWLDTPFDELPEEFRYTYTYDNERVDLATQDSTSTFDDLFDCLNVQSNNDEQHKLYRTLVRKTLMTMLKLHETTIQAPFEEVGGMLILVGSESTGKTTFCKHILPAPLRPLLTTKASARLRGDKGQRDFMRLLKRCTILRLDEFEGLIDDKNTSSIFKSIISESEVAFTEIYGTENDTSKRMAIIVASTNDTNQRLTDNGTRRMWFVPTGQIDTNKQLCINMHKLLNDMRKELRSAMARGKTPWMLTKEEIEVLEQENNSVRALTEADMILEELWPTDLPMPASYLSDIGSVQGYNGPRLWKFYQVFARVQMAPGGARITRKELEHALERHCGKWTRSTNITKPLVRPRAILSNGRLMQSKQTNGSYKYSYWVMPPQADNKDERDHLSDIVTKLARAHDSQGVDILSLLDEGQTYQ